MVSRIPSPVSVMMRTVSTLFTTSAVVRPVYQQLHQSIVFQDRHTGFPLAPIDQDLTLQV